MSFDELNDEQRLELKQRILVDLDDKKPDGPSYGELADADRMVSDDEARQWAEGMEFSPDDFSCSASEPNVRVRNVPQWALSYLVNADDSALTGEDKAMVDKWVDGLLAERLKLLCPIDGSENEFCSAPAFGLACDTVDFVARRVKEENKK